MSMVISVEAPLLEDVASKEVDQWLHVDWREVSSGGMWGLHLTLSTSKL